jgi:predicted nucleic acid-binding protein
VGLIDVIGPGPVALDTVAFIYFMEENPDFLPGLEPVFNAIDQGRLKGVTSALTLLEVLVGPLRAGSDRLAEQYEDLLTRSRGLQLVEIDRPQLRAAASIRAVYPRVRTPDALQLAAAAAGRCSALVTNDRQIPALPGMRVLQLGDYRGSG